MEPSKNGKGKFISITVAILGSVIVIGLIIGGALLASRRWDPTWNPFKPKAASQASVIRTIFK